MGWGMYLRWWTFSYLLGWAAIAAFDAWRDFVRLRDSQVGVISGTKAGMSQTPVKGDRSRDGL
jgi:hypothetical protein